MFDPIAGGCGHKPYVLGEPSYDVGSLYSSPRSVLPPNGVVNKIIRSDVDPNSGIITVTLPLCCESLSFITSPMYTPLILLTLYPWLTFAFFAISTPVVFIPEPESDISLSPVSLMCQSIKTEYC